VKLCHFDIFEDRCLHAITQKNTTLPLRGSVALHTGEPQKKVLQNRQKLLKKLGVSDFDVVLANQTHSSNIIIIEQNESKGWDSGKSAIDDCDGLITNKKNILIGVMSADCVPILLYDDTRQVVAAIHAGWRGTRDGIITKAVDKMITAFGCRTSDIVAGIGPSIGVCCYEVGDDVGANFDDEFKVETSNGKYMLDLKRVNQNQLIKAGLKKESIEVLSLCTSCDNDKFFSFRKERGCSGRFLSIIGLR